MYFQFFPSREAERYLSVVFLDKKLLCLEGKAASFLRNVLETKLGIPHDKETYFPMTQLNYIIMHGEWAEKMNIPICRTDRLCHRKFVFFNLQPVAL